MAAEPSKTEIQTLFKRLRAIPTNKVLETEGHGSWRRRRRRLLSPGARGRAGTEAGGFLVASSAGPRLWALTIHLSPLPPRLVSIVAPRARVGPASRTVCFCVLTAPECTAPWVSTSALSGRLCVRVLRFPRSAQQGERTSPPEPFGIGCAETSWQEFC